MVDCGAQPRFGSPDHVREIFRRASEARVPVSGAFDLTYRCNFRCQHCFVGHLTARPRSEAAELDTGQIVDLLSQAAQAGCLLMLFSGGEPLLRDDFVDIYSAARRLGMIVTVFTNASLVSEEHLDVFARFPPHEVEVSIYGASDETYERVTGVRGAFGLVRAGIERLLDGGARVSAKTMILRENAEDIPAIEAFARDYDLPFRLDPLITPRLNGDPAPLAQRVPPERAVEIEMAVDGLRESLEKLLRGRRAVAEQVAASRTDRLYLCGAGRGSFHLDCRGLMHPCLMSVGIAYNALSRGFIDSWRAVTTAVDQATWEGTGGCAECPHILLCGYCPALFALEHASPSKPPSYVCRLGENRSRVVEHEEVEVVGARAE